MTAVNEARTENSDPTKLTDEEIFNAHLGGKLEVGATASLADPTAGHPRPDARNGVRRRGVGGMAVWAQARASSAVVVIRRPGGSA